jgi:hypothetical protein
MLPAFDLFFGHDDDCEEKTEYLYATSFDLSAKCRLSAFFDRLG